MKPDVLKLKDTFHAIANLSSLYMMIYCGRIKHQNQSQSQEPSTTTGCLDALQSFQPRSSSISTSNFACPALEVSSIYLNTLTKVLI